MSEVNVTERLKKIAERFLLEDESAVREFIDIYRGATPAVKAAGLNILWDFIYPIEDDEDV